MHIRDRDAILHKVKIMAEEGKEKLLVCYIYCTYMHVCIYIYCGTHDVIYCEKTASLFFGVLHMYVYTKFKY